jgi:hypothetical protein
VCAGVRVCLVRPGVCCEPLTRARGHISPKTAFVFSWWATPRSWSRLTRLLPRCSGRNRYICMYVCVCVCICIYIYIYNMHKYIHAYMHTYIHVCVCVCVCVRIVCVYVYTYTHTSTQHTHTYIQYICIYRLPCFARCAISRTFTWPVTNFSWNHWRAAIPSWHDRTCARYSQSVNTSTA